MSPQHAEIIRMRQAGVGGGEIMRRLGVSQGVVAGVLYRAGLSWSVEGQKAASPAFKREVVEALRHDKWRWVTAHYGVSQSTISAWKRELG